MSPFLLEVFVCLVFALLFYHCCVKGRYNDVDPDNHDDLRRFRAGMWSREEGIREPSSQSRQSGVGSPDGGNGGMSASAEGARKELIEKCLFTRTIKREESVRELARLLAISRSNAPEEEIDVEAGECATAVVACENEDGPDAVVATGDDVPDDSPNGARRDDPASPPGELKRGASAPEPSAPPARARDADNVAVAISNPPDPPAVTPPARNSGTLEAVRGLWSSLAQNLSERGSNASGARAGAGAGAASASTSASAAAARNSSWRSTGKVECSICLEEYSPRDVVAWAKDGGDPTPSLSSAGIGGGGGGGGGACDHIFHRGCISAWLAEHDECPLCRRRLVHDDADVRFSMWGTMR